MKMFKIEKSSLEKISINFIVIFICIQPIFDIKIFYSSTATLIRVIIIGMLFSYCFFKDRSKKKYLFFVYITILIIYFILQFLNARNFTSLVPGNFNYSVVEEALYLLKMITPFLLIYVLYKLNIGQENVLKPIKILATTIGGIIIVSNLFLFSYATYSHLRISANFFSWFGNHTYPYQELASKGLFYMGNQIGAVLIMLLPFVIYSVIKETKKRNVLVLVINSFALMLLGTRVSVLGTVIVYLYTICGILIFDRYINKNKMEWKKIFMVTCILTIYVLLLPFNPTFQRIYEMDNLIDDRVLRYNEQIVAERDEALQEDVLETENIPIDNDRSMENIGAIYYIYENYLGKVHPQFIIYSYPYQYDPEFWLGIMEKDVTLRTNHRYIQREMIRRVIEINDNRLDRWFGITSTRLQNIFNIEQDFVVQYYALRNSGSSNNIFSVFCHIDVFYIQSLKIQTKRNQANPCLSICDSVFSVGNCI